VDVNPIISAILVLFGLAIRLGTTILHPGSNLGEEVKKRKFLKEATFPF
jgi:hypothetical protein